MMQTYSRLVGAALLACAVAIPVSAGAQTGVSGMSGMIGMEGRSPADVERRLKGK